MLHIILLILKIIGILLLAVLGILLLVLLTALLVPIRYQVAIEHGEAFFMKGRANWLLHLIHVNISHIEGELQIKVRLFGFVIYDSLKPKVPKKTTPKRKTSARNEKKRKPPKKVSTVLSKVQADKKKSEKAQKINIDQGKVINSSKQEAKADYADVINNNIVENASEKYFGNEVIFEDKNTNTTRNESVKDPIAIHKQRENTIELLNTNNSEKKSASDVKEQAIKAKEQGTYEKEQVTYEKEQGTNGKEQATNGKEQVADIKEAKKIEKESIFHKIISKMKSFIAKISKNLQELKAKVISNFMTLANLKHKLGLITDFIKDEINREGFQITYVSLKRLLKHILPTKLRSWLVFGTGDPCSTGQALGVLGILYSFYGDKIQIIPDFENSRLEGKHFARGRIRLVTILIIVGKLILDKKFKQLKRNFIILKEAL